MITDTMMFGSIPMPPMKKSLKSALASGGYKGTPAPKSGDNEIKFHKSKDHVIMTKGGLAEMLVILGDVPNSMTNITVIKGEELELYRMLYE